MRTTRPLALEENQTPRCASSVPPSRSRGNFWTETEGGLHLVADFVIAKPDWAGAANGRKSGSPEQ